MKMRAQVVALAVAAFLSCGPIQAHEFWIEGTPSVKGAQSTLTLDLKVGQKLEGVSLPYIDTTFSEFSWVAGGVGDIDGALGDVPAAEVPFDADKGAVIFHRTEPRRLQHKDWQLFLDYLEMEGLTGIAEEHDARGLPRIDFVETYTRHAKLILPSRRGEIGDQFQGSPHEIVLSSATMNGSSVTLVGQLMSDADAGRRQITAFRRDGTQAAVQTFMTDANGRFTLSMKGEGPILLNAVDMRPGIAGESAWHSDWASVFVVVGQQ